LTNIKCELHNF